MKKIKILFRIFFSNMTYFFRMIVGNKVKCNSILTLISPKSSLNTFGKGHIYLGKKIEIRANTELTARNGSIFIGDNCFINKNCMLVSHVGIQVGDCTTIGPGTVIYDHDHSTDGGYVKKKIVIGKNVWIGAGCIILKGVTIGDNVIIGAGTLVSKDIENGKLVIDKRNQKIL